MMASLRLREFDQFFSIVEGSPGPNGTSLTDNVLPSRCQAFSLDEITANEVTFRRCDHLPVPRSTFHK